jgi:hypothetical protein
MFCRVFTIFIANDVTLFISRACIFDGLLQKRLFHSVGSKRSLGLICVLAGISDDQSWRERRRLRASLAK